MYPPRTLVPSSAMDETSEHHRPPNLKRSDYSLDSSSTIAASPGSPVHHRPGYHRITSLNEVDTSYERLRVDASDRDAQVESSSSLGIAGKGFGESSGLGIGNLDIRRPMSVPRVTVGSKSSPSPPPSADPLLSPSSRRGERDSRGLERHFEEDEMEYGEHGRNGSHPAAFEPFTASSDHERLNGTTPPTAEMHIRSQEPTGRIVYWIIRG